MTDFQSLSSTGRLFSTQRTYRARPQLLGRAVPGPGFSLCSSPSTCGRPSIFDGTLPCTLPATRYLEINSSLKPRLFSYKKNKVFYERFATTENYKSLAVRLYQSSE